MRNTFINCLIEQAETDSRIFLLSADLGYSVLEKFIKAHPDRYLNVGIAEQNMISVAAGLALSGKIVYAYSIIPFITMRCFEQIRIDVAYMKTNVRIIGVGAGYSYGAAGASHHSIEDIAIMRSLPNMAVCCPGDPVELRCLLKESFNYNGPMYFRLGKGGEPNIHPDSAKITLGKAVKITQGSDLILITTSNMLEQGKQITDEAAAHGKKICLVSYPTIKPFDKDMILDLILQQIPIITLEEHNIIGGLGSAVAEVIAESGLKADFKRVGINDEFTHIVGSQKLLSKIMVLNNW